MSVSSEFTNVVRRSFIKPAGALLAGSYRDECLHGRTQNVNHLPQELIKPASWQKNPNK